MPNDTLSCHVPSSDSLALMVQPQANYGSTRASSTSSINQLKVDLKKELGRPPSTRTASSNSTASEFRPEEVSSSATQRRIVQRTREQATKEIRLTLKNTGSVARDHLANERTYLAYVRTSLGMSSVGVTIVQLFRLSSLPGTPYPDTHDHLQYYAQALGATLVLTGLLTLFVGLSRFFAVQRALPEGNFPVSQRIIIVPAIVLAVVICIVFGVLVALRVPSL